MKRNTESLAKKLHYMPYPQAYETFIDDYQSFDEPQALYNIPVSKERFYHQLDNLLDTLPRESLAQAIEGYHLNNPDNEYPKILALLESDNVTVDSILALNY